MKKLSLFVLLITIFLSACKKDAVTSAYDTSLSKFQSFNKSAKKGYTYTAVRSYFAWIHSRVETKITVVNGAITARDYVAYNYVSTPGVDTLIQTVAEQWHEEGAALNSHDNTWFLTLDQVYTTAKKDWLSVDPKKNDISFETNNNGMISSAGYVPKGCVDDCFFGINISSITAL